MQTIDFTPYSHQKITDRTHIIFILLSVGLLLLYVFLSVQQTVINPIPFVTHVSAENQSIKEYENTIVQAVEQATLSVITVHRERIQENDDIPSFSTINIDEGMQKTSRTRSRLQEQNVGSGIIISKDGTIVTNKHVVEDEDSTYFVLVGNRKIRVKNIYFDKNRELAVLKINSFNLKPARLGDSNTVKPGQLAIAMGSALGDLRNSVTIGYISGMNRAITVADPGNGKATTIDHLIQTDAAINFGNSGGALINSSGEIIGITTAAAPFGENIGFAIPINEVKDMLKEYNK